jgi:DNA polymerase
LIPQDGASGLELVAREVRSCTLCELHRGTTQGVPGEGPSDARVMCVGEGPGFNEDRLGRPFVGAAGRYLDEVLLPLAGLRRAEVYITNVVKHRPPDNRDPLPNELVACHPYLERQIEAINPAVIVTLGRYSLATFCPGDMISRVHGRIRLVGGRHVFPMYHPAAALRQDSLKRVSEDDMRRLGEFLREFSAETPAEEEADEPPEQLALF